MDEIHYLADKFRGAVWEEVILHLSADVQVVGLSATVSNAEEFGSWLAEVRGELTVVVDEIRPVPLWQHMLVGRRLFDLFGGADPAAGDPAGARLRIDPTLVRAVHDAEAMADRFSSGGRQPRRGGPGGAAAGGGRERSAVPGWAAVAAAAAGRRHRKARRRRASAGDHLHLLARRLRRRGGAVRASRGCG